MASLDDPVEWARQTLSAAVVEPLRTRPWADVWRVAASDGRWWLKVNKQSTVYEPRLLAVLAGTGSSLVPESIVHPDEPWAVIRDAGTQIRARFAEAEPSAILAFWCDLLPAYADLQRVTPRDTLPGIGVPDLSPDRLVAQFDALLSAQEWFTREINPELSADELSRIRNCRDALAAAASELAGGVAPTIQHDDLHDGNVFLASDTGDAERALIIDWGDAVIAHPFSTLRVTLDVLAAILELPAGAPELARVRDAYLEPWLAAGESWTDLLRQTDLAIRTGGLIRATGWARALGTPQAGLELGFADGPSGWLQRLADDLPDSDQGPGAYSADQRGSGLNIAETGPAARS